MPEVLPGPGAKVIDIHGHQNTTPNSGTATGGIYVQDFEGLSTTFAPRMVVTTERAQPGALAHYSQPPSRQISLNGGIAYLDPFPSHLQLLWQASSGVVVSLEAINIDATALETIAGQLTVAPGQSGVAVSGTLPDALVQVGAGGNIDNDGLRSGDTSDNSVAYLQDGCDAILQIVPGSTFATADAIAISAGNGQTISVNGHHAVEITWPSLYRGSTPPTLTTVIWTYKPAADGQPGVMARLQGACTNIPALAAQLHTVDPLTWTNAVHSLGKLGSVDTSPQTPTAPPTLAPRPIGPVNENFGIAQ